MRPLPLFVLAGTFVMLLVLSGCKKEPAEIPINNYVHFPIGQKSIHDSTLKVEADSVIQEYTIFHDEYGGRWVRIAFHKLNMNSVVKISFLHKAGPLVLLPQIGPVPEMWKSRTNYIDCDHPLIIEKANHLTNGIDGVINKAKNIQIFVGDWVEFLIYKDSGLVSASSTLQNQYGTCINYARLFVALCRATGIPARSVWGCVYNGYNFNGHHNWAEFLDQDGNWHAVDFSFSKVFDLNDIRYLDLLYSAEENVYLRDYHSYRISGNGDYFFYDGSPSAVDGKLYVNILSNNFPDEMELSMSYAISKMFED